MKLLIITSIKEDVHGVNQIMEKAGIPVFSVTATAGHKTQHHSYALDNWFGKNENTTDALLFVSFCLDAQAYLALQLVKEHTVETDQRFPIHAFILPVEQHS